MAGWKKKRTGRMEEAARTSRLKNEQLRLIKLEIPKKNCSKIDQKNKVLPSSSSCACYYHSLLL